MITKYMLSGALVGALILFFWGFATHAGIPGYVLEFKDPQAVNQFVRAQAPENGVYFTEEGVLVSVALEPDMHKRTDDMALLLVREGLACILTAALLAMALVWARTESVLGGAKLLGLLGVAGFVAGGVSGWNWWGLSARFVMVDAVDLIGGWFFAGLALGALKKKFSA
jgi:hypothetical protein